MIEFLKKVIITLLKLLFCFFFTIMVGYSIVLIWTLGIKDTGHLDWQIVFYISFGCFLILGVWINSFFKTPDKFKLLFIVLFPIWFFSPFFLPSVMHQINVDTCIDDGICSEGVKLGKNVVTKEFCLQHDYEWNDNKKWCDMNKKIPHTVPHTKVASNRIK